MNTFTVGAESIEFTQAPQQGQQSGTERYQVDARDSSGNFYLYKKSTIKRRFYSLAYECQTRATVDAAFLFFELHALGTKKYVNWIDHTGEIRQVKYRDNSINWRKTGPDSYTISFAVEVEI